MSQIVLIQQSVSEIVDNLAERTKIFNSNFDPFESEGARGNIPGTSATQKETQK